MLEIFVFWMESLTIIVIIEKALSSLNLSLLSEY